MNLKSALLVLLIASMAHACGGEGGGANPLDPQPQITEAGNPPAGGSKPKKLRSITGRVPQNPNGANPPCQAVRAITTDTAGFEKSIPVSETCNFIIEVQIEKAWAFRFELADGSSRALEFENGPGNLSSVYYVSDERTPTSLGQVTFFNARAFAQYEATQQSDRDGDNINDYLDPDDDNDGIADADEPDCDLDGIIDDDDLSSDCG